MLPYPNPFVTDWFAVWLTNSFRSRRSMTLKVWSWERNNGSFGASSSELTEVMVGVEIAPPGPFVGFHLPEHRVRTMRLGQRVAKAGEHYLQRFVVSGKFSRCGAAFSLL
jgi:hypothetical protein